MDLKQRQIFMTQDYLPSYLVQNTGFEFNFTNYCMAAFPERNVKYSISPQDCQ